MLRRKARECARCEGTGLVRDPVLFLTVDCGSCRGLGKTSKLEEDEDDGNERNENDN